jgi:hypothetical protein
LLAKTIENGCTEAEAMAAIEIAQKLMTEHEISLEDLKLEDEKAIVARSDMRTSKSLRMPLGREVRRDRSDLATIGVSPYHCR